METRREQIKRIFVDNVGLRFQLPEQVKEKVLKNAVNKYFDGNPADIIAIKDTTVLLNGKEGYLLTEDALYCDVFYKKLFKIPGNRIEFEGLTNVVRKKTDLIFSYENKNSVSAFFSIYAEKFEACFQQLISETTGATEVIEPEAVQAEPEVIQVEPEVTQAEPKKKTAASKKKTAASKKKTSKPEISQEEYQEAMERIESEAEPTVDVYSASHQAMKMKNTMTPYEGEEPYIFVSYSHRDKEAVESIIFELQFFGYRVWYDEGINPGSEWDDNIAEHVENCHVLLAIVSNSYVQSENCKDELNFARDLDKNRLLVYIEDTELPSGMKMRLSRLQALYYHKYENVSDFYAKLHSTPGFLECRDQDEMKKNAKREVNAEKRNSLVLYDGMGNPMELDFLDLIEYEGEEYVILLPPDDEDASEVIILQLGKDERSQQESYLAVEDEEILTTVFELFKEKFQKEFDFQETM